ncbi:SurA N-terminal domain-containing protein [Fluoribacter dumoffii]|uniref:hypothetical protein n=1 Tax=Fluoribacter dumoffii TaxID=463 RepID=UPI002242F747|nr:hypothetical protein [Fluoribacter dumoffii]MCW8416777.1 SurA N-terminal domain-containing protein [Fluoribacter dumoffii]MCW8455383.1 SurA N-terminal domain-containing protein [Fluoribacter dumoffii]MCW8460539.1 SurA N-terminal domain-containing protein [Fluoribacter dumoffii]MCW8484020.1 SurA N-terminal domain-containing protein [Fluoribacter dumoffii]
MAKNTLFNFLFHNEANIQLPHGHKLVLGVNKSSQHAYYRLELPRGHYLIKDGKKNFLLDNHHISIYENEFRDDPKLSQYHYTAEFQYLGETYRLHVYFNAFDQLNQNIAFEKWTEDGYKTVDTKNIREQLLILALNHTEPLLKMVRQQHHQKIKELENRYQACDEKLNTYFDTETSTAEILKITEEACEILRELLPLIRSASYAGILKFHEATVRALRKMDTTPSESGQPLASNANIAPESEEMVDIQDPASLADGSLLQTKIEQEELKKTRQTHPSAPSQNRALHKVEEEIQKLSTEFQELSKAPIEIQAQKIEQLLAKTYEINLLYEQTIKLKYLPQLEKIRRGLQKLEANLLPELLFTNKFELAALLTSAFYLLRAEKYMSVALQTRNAKLLDFLLTHGDIDINQQTVSARKIQFPSAVHACLQLDSPSTPMSECLSVLIKHGASLFAPDNKGLPLVYSILAEEAHPLYKALFMTRERTIDSVDFFKKLIPLLKAYLETDTLTDIEKNRIESQIHSFEYQLDILENVQLQDPSSRFLMKRINHLEEKYLGDLVRKLRQDPDVVAINKKLQLAAKVLNSKISRAQQRQANIIYSQNFDNLEKLLSRVDVKELDYDLIKASALESLNIQLQLIEAKAELLDLQKEIRRTPVVNNGGRKYKERLRRQDELLREIRQLEQKYAGMQNIDEVNRGLEELESLNTVIESLGEQLEGLEGVAQLLSQFSSIFSSKGIKLSITEENEDTLTSTEENEETHTSSGSEKEIDAPSPSSH